VSAMVVIVALSGIGYPGKTAVPWLFMGTVRSTIFLKRAAGNVSI